MELPRRDLVLLGVGSLLLGCSSRGTAEPTPSRAASPTAAGSTAATPSPSPSRALLPDVRPWQPSPADLEPDCKRAAARRVERDGAATGRVVEVIDAQYGGLLPDSASVLVSTRDYRLQDAEVVRGGRTYDVRLTRSARTWRVTDVLPSRPGPRSPRPSRAARRVLGEDRVELPPAAARDVASGWVADQVLEAMLVLAGSFRVGVSVVRSGHPLAVFGTDRPSDHPSGLAFDTWSIDGRPVVDRRTPRSLVTDYMQASAAAGSDNVGGPYLLGSGPQWFSDDTHQDHVHAGFG